MTRIAVTGRSGQVVSALIERAGAAGVEILPIGRPEFDLENATAGLDAIAALAPDLVISAAAYTAVDKAESEEERAFAANRDGPAALAGLTAKLGIPIIHISTDYVFDGSKAEPYLESDATGPLGVYGRSKLAGEQAVQAANPDHAILRTAWVYSPFGANFLRTMLRLGEERSTVRVVDDQIGAPTSALDMADAILRVAANLHAHPGNNEMRGVFHLTGSGWGSWADFAEHIFASASARGRPPVAVERIPTSQYPTPAHRPANSRLDTSRIRAVHGVDMPQWRPSATQVVERLLAGDNSEIVQGGRA
ncbi:MAG: dTDP-4-dehydrorhamnose reductase [Pelagibacterium sp. SCN 64-44]|nr:MAG: dTDP-4-dehydrorhamnose reductase [Pelagibacterium sp. SCN 64-44]